MTELEILKLSFNKITEIDGYLFSHLSNLKHLDLDNNKLNLIDCNTFKGLVKLEGLYLNNNEITQIDGSLFSALQNLKAFRLDFSKLNRIDSITFKHLSNLNDLFINDAKIRLSSNENLQFIEKLATLEGLSINFNDTDIKEINLDFYKNLKL